MRSHREVVIIFILGLVVSLFALSNHEFIGFESRFGLFAQEMLRNGPSFFPTTYNHFYPDYLATQTILTYLFSLPFGKITIYTAVLPTAIATAVTLVFTYLIGATQSPRWGLYAVLFTLFSFDFLSAARTISLDQFTAAVTTASFYCIYSAKLYQSPKRLGFIPLFLILGFAFRGPIGLVIPASVVGIFYLLEKDYRNLVITSFISAFSLGFCMLALLAAAWHDGGMDFAKNVLSMQITYRIHADAAPFYYYFTSALLSFSISFPLACLILIANAKQLIYKSTPTLNLLKHLAGWLLIILIGMSIPSAKKIRYILAIVPACALIAAYLFSEPQQGFLNKLRIGILKLCQLLPLLGLVAAIVTNSISIILLFLLQIIIAIKYRKNELITFIIGLAAFITIYISIIQPIDIKLNQTFPFVTKVEALRSPQQQLVFYAMGPDGNDIKYMVALDKAVQPQFLQTPDELIKFNKPALFVAEQKRYQTLPDAVKKHTKIIVQGQLGHEPTVGFVLIPDTHPTP